MARRYLGPEGSASFLEARDATFGHLGWARISVVPERADVLDFGANRFPSAWALAATLQP
jgi:hypothetical protein